MIAIDETENSDNTENNDNTENSAMYEINANELWIEQKFEVNLPENIET